MPDNLELPDNALTEAQADVRQVTSPAHWTTPPTLATEDTLLNIRTAKITSEHLTTLRDAVATDLRRIYVQTNDLSSLTADRFEEVEARIKTLEGKAVSQGSGSSPQSLGDGEPPGGPPPGTAYTGNDSRNTLSEAVLPQAVAQIQTQSSFETSRSPRPIQTPSPTFSEPFPQDTPIPPRLSHKRSERFFVSALGIKVPLNISPFSGAPHENFAAFLRTFEDYARASKSELTDKEKLAHFLTLLNDYARDKAEEVREKNEEATFDEIVDHMRTTFQNPARAETEKQLLRQATQRDDENVDQFSTRIRKLAQGAYPDKSRDYIQEKAKEAFVEGLPKNVRFHVKSSTPDTFQQAHDAAVKFEVLLGQAMQGNTITPQGLVVYSPTPAPALPRPQQLAFQSRGPCFRCGQLGHYAAHCGSRPNMHWNHDNGFRGQNRHSGFDSSLQDNRGNFGTVSQDNGQDFGHASNNNPQGLCNGPQYYGRVNQHSFSVATPQDARQLPTQPRPINRYVNAYAYPENPEVLQLREQVQDLKNQVAALTKRNNELAAAVIPTTPIRRVNALSAIPKLGSLLTLFTLFCLFNSSLAVSPLMCKPHTLETLFGSLPHLTAVNWPRHCSPSHPSSQLLVLRDNTINHQVNGIMCKIVKRTTLFSVNFIGIRWHETSSEQIIIPLEACYNMRQSESCEHGALVRVNRIFRTTNPHIIQWPSAPFAVFQGVQTVETFNCFILPITVTGNTKAGVASIQKPTTRQQYWNIEQKTTLTDQGLADTNRVRPARGISNPRNLATPVTQLQLRCDLLHQK